MPYLSKRADLVQLANLREKCSVNNWPLTGERFSNAMLNYFQSELGTYTLAHFCSNFSTFFNAPVDRFGKPKIQESKHADSTNAANGRNRQSNSGDCGYTASKTI